MKTVLVFAMLSAIGVSDWGAFGADAAFAVVAAKKEPKPAPAKKCCDECKGSGSITSGDGLAKFPCSCDPLCACKGKAAAAPPAICKDGKCSKPSAPVPVKKPITSSGVRRWRR